MSYWVAVDKPVFRRFVSSCEEFKKRKFVLSEILDKIETLEDEVEEYLQNFVWHRIDKAAPLMNGALRIKMPPIGDLMKHIIVRHDIIHRGGKTKDGSAVIISNDVLTTLKADISVFVEAVEGQLTERYPRK